jgi:carbamoyl-phosphate synthase large subunit
MKNVLILSAGRRVSLYKFFNKELNNINFKYKVFCGDSNIKYSAAANFSKNHIKLKPIKDKKFIENLKFLCIKYNVRLVIPTTDLELIKLSNNQNEFRKKNIELLISKNDFIKQTNNKLFTEIVFKTIGLRYPKIYSNINKIKFPAYAKPVQGSSSKNNYIIKNMYDFEYCKNKYNDLIFMKYYNSKLFTEYTLDLYYDKKETLKCLVARERIETKDGEVSKSKTNKKLSKLLWNKFSLLKNARGPITAQIFVNNKNNEVIAIEINARFGGGYPLSYYAGANYVKYILKEYIQNKQVFKNMSWKNNLLMLRYDDEIIC